MADEHPIEEGPPKGTPNNNKLDDLQEKSGAALGDKDVPRHKSKKEKRQLKKQKKLQLQQKGPAPEKTNQPQDTSNVADGKELQQRPQKPSDKEGNWQVKEKKRKKPKKAQQTKESAEKGTVASKPGRYRRRYRKRKEAFQIIPAAGKPTRKRSSN